MVGTTRLKMRTRKVILGELIDFLKEPNREFKPTYETKLLEDIFELLLDMRDMQQKQMDYEKVKETMKEWKKSIKK